MDVEIERCLNDQGFAGQWLNASSERSMLALSSDSAAQNCNRIVVEKETFLGPLRFPQRCGDGVKEAVVGSPKSKAACKPSKRAAQVDMKLGSSQMEWLQYATTASNVPS